MNDGVKIMKKIAEHRDHEIYFVTIGKVGYFITTYDFRIVFAHELNGAMCGPISDVANKSREICDKLILCTRDELRFVDLYGVDISMDTDLMPSDLDHNEMKQKIVDQFQPEFDKLKANYLESVEKKRLEDFKNARIKEVRDLLKQFRYSDAREHCSVCKLDFEVFLEEARRSNTP